MVGGYDVDLSRVVDNIIVRLAVSMAGEHRPVQCVQLHLEYIRSVVSSILYVAI